MRDDLIDGDAFEALARKLGLAYFETHAIDRDRLDGVVLTHNSDGCILPSHHLPLREYDFVWQDIPDTVVHWFGQNVDVVDERLTPLPIGLERERWYPELKKHDLILTTPRGEKTGLLYLNANTRIVSQREALYQQFEGQSWVTCERGYNALNFPHYACQLAAHQFVLCPDGNGFDTHRTWEALYMGAYPIVERHVFTEYFARLLPLLVIDDWAEVTPDYLEHQAVEFETRTWMWEALTMGYWEELLNISLLRWKVSL